MSESDDSPLDRAMQRALLLAMRKVYPAPIREAPVGIKQDSREFDANLLYLEDHGLCDAGLHGSMSGEYSWGGATITARGLDFLEGDGGLSAILGVITVRLHAETIRDLIAAKIDSAPVPEAEKSVLRRHLAALSETALRAGTTDLVKTGLNHLPDAMHWLRTLVGL